MKSLNQWSRKIHRWLAIPFVIIVIVTNMTATLPIGQPIRMLQQISMLTLIITGLYLYLLPYLSKWQRNRRKRGK